MQKNISKRKVLIVAGYYIPGIKGGGPIKSIKNIVDNLNKDFEFYIIAFDRDLGDKDAYKSIVQDQWQEYGNAKVYYISPKKFTNYNLYKIMNSINYDVLYLNTLFGIKLALVPLIINNITNKRKKIVLAPRGQLSQGALELKSIKKLSYIKLVKVLGVCKDITWHATADTEKKDIISIFGKNAKVKVANNLTSNYKDLEYKKQLTKIQGNLRIIFLSRITPKKNLKKAIQLLKDIKGEVIFDIYGPIEDKQYWKECEEEIKILPKNISVNYKGIINHSETNELFNKYHIFLFPTLGENFGHVISEALIGGCPVVISDTTPWRNLEKYNSGYDIELHNDDKFKYIIQQYVDINKEQYELYSRSAFKYGKLMSNSIDSIECTKDLFI